MENQNVTPFGSISSELKSNEAKMFATINEISQLVREIEQKSNKTMDINNFNEFMEEIKKSQPQLVTNSTLVRGPILDTMENFIEYVKDFDKSNIKWIRDMIVSSAYETAKVGISYNDEKLIKLGYDTYLHTANSYPNLFEVSTRYGVNQTSEPANKPNCNNCENDNINADNTDKSKSNSELLSEALKKINDNYSNNELIELKIENALHQMRYSVSNMQNICPDADLDHVLVSLYDAYALIQNINTLATQQNIELIKNAIKSYESFAHSYPQLIEEMKTAHISNHNTVDQCAVCPAYGMLYENLLEYISTVDEYDPNHQTCVRKILISSLYKSESQQKQAQKYYHALIERMWLKGSPLTSDDDEYIKRTAEFNK
jgi:hypothetical protein